MSAVIDSLLALAAVLGALVAFGVAWRMMGERRDARRFLPPGSMVDVGGTRLHAVVTGGAGPTVVFDSALGASHLSWWRVQPVVAEWARTLAYDRAGHGYSEPAVGERDLETLAGELGRLLVAARLDPPYLLVGHSFGALVVRRLAIDRAADVGGLVLVDPADPADLLTAQQQRRVVVGAFLARRGRWAARCGLARLVGALATTRARTLARGGAFLASGGVLSRGGASLVAPMSQLPPPARARLRSQLVRPRYFAALEGQLAAMAGGCARLVDDWRRLDLPVIVLSAENTRALNERAVADLSSRVELRVVSGTGHWIQLDRPDAVAEAIRDVAALVGR